VRKEAAFVSYTIAMQDWVTMKGSAAGTVATQPESDYLDISAFEDYAAYVEVSDFVVGIGTNVKLQTSPVKEDAYFQDLTTVTPTVTGLPDSACRHCSTSLSDRRNQETCPAEPCGLPRACPPARVPERPVPAIVGPEAAIAGAPARHAGPGDCSWLHEHGGVDSARMGKVIALVAGALAIGACGEDEVAFTGAAGGSAPLPCGIGCTTIVTDVCSEGRCNTETKACEVIPAAEGTACDDGAFCTTEDACNGMGQCAGGPENDCGLPANSCRDIVVRRPTSPVSSSERPRESPACPRTTASRTPSATPARARESRRTAPP
jgi:hypothetical protein